MKKLNRVELYELVRDGTTLTGAQRILMDALAWRASATDNYSCYPSYARLALDTHYTAQNLRIAMRELERAVLIKRTRRRRRSNLYHLNIQLLTQMATEKRALLAKGETWDIDPFNSAAMFTDAEEDNTDVLDEEPQTGVETGEESDLLTETFDHVLELVRKIWPGHQSFDGDDYLEGDLEDCIELAETTVRCGQLLCLVRDKDPKTIRAVGKSGRLGAYLRKSFPGWLRTYADELLPVHYNPDDAEETQ